MEIKLSVKIKKTILILLVFLAFGISVKVPFHFDDKHSIV